ncbi:MAG: BON domain-containing protein [Isosphaeraceae bacterium]
MSVRMTILAAALTILALSGTEAFAQNAAPADPPQGSTGPQGHTLDDLGRGIKDEAKKVGKKLDQVGQGIKLEAGRVTSGVAQEFEVVRSDVQKLPLHHRVYSRIHWDKMLHDAKIQVHMLRDGVVLLRGTVPTEAARRHAVDLTKDSVGVKAVINELTIPSKVAAAQPAAPAKPASRR